MKERGFARGLVSAFFGVLLVLYLAVSVLPLFEIFGFVPEIFDQTRLHVTSVLVVFFLICLLSKNWLLASLVAVVVVFNLSLITSAFSVFEENSNKYNKNEGIRVLSLNVNIENSDIDGISRLIEGSGADVVLILEANNRLAPALGRALVDHYPYRTYSNLSEASRGFVGFSKHKLQSSENYMPMGISRQKMLFIPVNFNGSIVNIYGIHLLSPIGQGVSSRDRIATRNHQINLLTKHISSSNGNVPFIIAGDMNSVPWQASMLEMKRILNVRGSARITDLNGTWPASMPKFMGFPIDHIYYSSELCHLRGGVIEIPGSDHRAVYSDFDICK